MNLFDTRSGKFTHYTTSSGDYPISSNDILSLYAGRDSTLWIGTSYGLNRLSPTAGGRGGFRWYIEKDGLPNNTIHGILEDDSGNLWLSTNKGLAQLNPADNRIISYYNNEELQSNEFSDGAYYRSRDGRMYFGGVAGFNRFDPRDIRVRTYAPAVQLNNFLIKQTPVPGFRADREIVLSHSETFQHPVLCAGIHPQRQLRIRLHPQGVQRRLGGDRHRQHGGVHQRAARGL